MTITCWRALSSELWVNTLDCDSLASFPVLELWEARAGSVCDRIETSFGTWLQGQLWQNNALIWEWSQLQPGDISTKYYEGNSQEPLKTNLPFFIALRCFYRLQEKQLKNNLQILSQEWVTNYIKSILSLPLIKKSKTTKWERLKKETAKAASIEPAVL